MIINPQRAYTRRISTVIHWNEHSKENDQNDSKPLTYSSI